MHAETASASTGDSHAQTALLQIEGARDEDARDASLLAWLGHVTSASALPEDAHTASLLGMLRLRAAAWARPMLGSDLSCDPTPAPKVYAMRRAAAAHARIAEELRGGMLDRLRTKDKSRSEYYAVIDAVMRRAVFGTSVEAVRDFVPYAVAAREGDDNGGVHAHAALERVRALDVAGKDACGALSLDAVLRFVGDSYACSPICLHVAEMLLPRFFTDAPGETVRRCMDTGLMRGYVYYIHVTAARLRPTYFVLHGDLSHAEQDRETAGRCALLRPDDAGTLHPYVVASMLCCASDWTFATLAVHECGAQHCEWWRMFVEHLLLLHRRATSPASCSDVCVAAAPVRLLWLGLALSKARRFREAAELQEGGVDVLSHAPPLCAQNIVSQWRTEPEPAAPPRCGVSPSCDPMFVMPCGVGSRSCVSQDTAETMAHDSEDVCGASSSDSDTPSADWECYQCHRDVHWCAVHERSGLCYSCACIHGYLGE